MKKWISVSAMAMVMAFATVALSAQAAGAKQAPPAPPAKTAPKKDEPKKDDKKMAAPCKAGEHLKDAKKPKSKTNPCVKG
jgi:hypothetical protein